MPGTPGIHITLPLDLFRVRRRYEDMTDEEKSTIEDKYEEMEAYSVFTDPSGIALAQLGVYDGPVMKFKIPKEDHQVLFTLDTTDISSATSATYDFDTSDNDVPAYHIQLLITYIIDTYPHIKDLYVRETYQGPDGIDRLARSIARNGETYIHQMFNVIVADISESELQAHEDTCMSYISEERKASMPWPVFLEKYPMLADHAVVCEPIYVASRRIIDFVREVEDTLPVGVINEFVASLVEKEIGFVPRLHKHIIGDWLWRDDDDDDDEDEESDREPHCCACEGCFDDPSGCSAGFVCMDSSSHKSESSASGSSRSSPVHDNREEESPQSPETIRSLSEIGVASDIMTGLNLGDEPLSTDQS
jgi:hypothetical protein